MREGGVIEGEERRGRDRQGGREGREGERGEGEEEG